MQTLNLTITLPDLIRFDDRDALEMQVLFVKSLVENGRIDFNDPTQRTAVLEWYQKLLPHLQPTAAGQAAWRLEMKRHFGLPEQERPLAEIVADLDAEMDRLEKANGWTVENYEQWPSEHARTSHGRA